LDDGGLPAARRRRRLLSGEPARDRHRSEPLAHVELEDALHDRRLPLVRDDVLLLVAPVAERQPPGRPASLLRPALDPGGDAVDDRGVLELREHTQHLQHHPTRSRPGVERLRRRAERAAEPVQLLGQLRELAHVTREPIDPIDKQQIDLPFAGEVESALEAGTRERRAGHSVLLLRHHPPALLASDRTPRAAPAGRRARSADSPRRSRSACTDRRALALHFLLLDESRTTGWNGSVANRFEQELGE
jgi:hypothetical protein